MRSSFENLVELGEEIGLFVVLCENNEYIIGKKELMELKNTVVSIKEIEKATFEFVTNCSKKLLISVA